MSEHKLARELEIFPPQFECMCGERFSSRTLLDEHLASASVDAGAGRDERSTSRAAGCCKRVTLSDGRYGFCILPVGHELPAKDKDGNIVAPPLADKCTAHVSAPPPPSTFSPRKK